LFDSSHEIVKYLCKPISEDNSTPDKRGEGCIDVYKILGEKGWDMTRLYLGYGSWRCEWEDGID
jgi:hypothetical protein